MGLFGVGFLPDVDKGNQRDDAPGDLQNEGEPAVFREKADGHEDGGGEVEALIENTVFDFVGGEEKVGSEIEELVKDAVFQDVER